MRNAIIVCCVMLLIMLLVLPADARKRRSRSRRARPAATAPKLKPLLSPTHKRIVFLGDSITDGNTYPAWVKQALKEAGYTAPVVINAGIGGSTILDMLARLERDVIALKPTLVAVNAGVNDVHRGVSADSYEAALRSIAARLRTEKIPLLLITPSVVGDTTDGMLANQFSQAMHRVAEQYDYPVAEANTLMRETRAAGMPLLSPDGIHPNFAGQRLIAQSVLTALGYTGIQAPAQFKPEVIPGLIGQWKMRAVTDPREAPLDAVSVKRVSPADGWVNYAVPEKDPVAGEWEDSERQRGFAWSLTKLVGPGTRYIGVANIKATKSKPVFFNTGAQLGAIWLNGTRIYKFDSSVTWPGWHIGKQRIPARLKRGSNIIVIETPGPFAVSVTDGNDR